MDRKLESKSEEQLKVYHIDGADQSHASVGHQDDCISSIDEDADQRHASVGLRDDFSSSIDEDADQSHASVGLREDNCSAINEADQIISPLADHLFKKLKDFEFGRRLFVNFPTAALLIKHLGFRIVETLNEGFR